MLSESLGMCVNVVEKSNWMRAEKRSLALTSRRLWGPLGGRVEGKSQWLDSVHGEEAERAIIDH